MIGKHLFLRAASCGPLANGQPVACGIFGVTSSGFAGSCLSCCCSISGAGGICNVAGAFAPGAACGRACRCASGICNPTADPTVGVCA